MTALHGIGRIVAAGITAAAVAVGPVTPTLAASASPARHPHISLSPSSAVVNQRVQVVGTGFPADTKVTLQECGAASWIAPQDPCNRYLVKVETGAHGAFRTSLKARTCPEVRAPQRTQRTCWVGEVAGHDVDVLYLVGAAKLVVTRT